MSRWWPTTGRHLPVTLILTDNELSFFEDEILADRGIPYYLERFTDDRPLRDHIPTEVIESTGLLHSEAELMLRQSLADPTNHIAVLRPIASGHNRNSEISSRTRLQPGSA